MRKILIPTDFSGNAMNAIKYALELFKCEHSEVFLIHAYADEVYDNKTILTRALFDEFREEIKKKSDKQLEETLLTIREFSPNPRHKYQAISKFGNLIDEVNDFVDKQDIDLIVMGTRGKTNGKTVDFGSNTIQVIKYVKCPVLAIPRGYDQLNLSRVLFPTNYQLPYKQRELKLVSTLAKSCAAKVVFLYISKFKELSFRQQDNVDYLKNILTENELEFSNAAGEDLIQVISNEITEEKIDMLVMVNSRKSYLESLLYPSTVQKLGLQIQIPFLVLQNLAGFN
jgi:nucleotide-binding universal stress UspA family protein